MNQSLQMPFVETSFSSGTVRHWSKKPGEAFAFGDELCVIQFEDAVFLRKPRSASRLTGLKSRSEWKRHKIVTRPIGKIQVQVVASEPGVVRQLVVGEGEYSNVGEVLAVLQTSEGDFEPTPESELAGLPPLRVVANHLEAEGS